MDRNGRLLRRAALVLFVSFAAAFSRPLPASAAPVKSYSTDDLDGRLAAYGIQLVELAADFLLFELDLTTETLDLNISWEENITSMNGTAESFANAKHLAYADDHRTVTNRRSYFGDGYEANLNGRYGGGGTAGYREPDGLHAELYRRRVAGWRDAMKGMLAGNRDAMLDILNLETVKLPRILSSEGGARDDGAGYTQRAGEAAYLEAVLSDELLKLNADIDRRLALETRIALNEQLERSDAVAAYGLAVGDWRPAPVTAGGGY